LHLRSLPAPAAGVQLVNKASGEVLIDHDTGLPLWPDCNRRRLCPLAAKRYTRKIRLRLLRIAWRTMLTVTMPPELGKANRENIAVQGKALRRLLRVLKRRAGQFQIGLVPRTGTRPPSSSSSSALQPRSQPSIQGANQCRGLWCGMRYPSHTRPSRRRPVREQRPA